MPDHVKSEIKGKLESVDKKLKNSPLAAKIKDKMAKKLTRTAKQAQESVGKIASKVKNDPNA